MKSTYVAGSPRNSRELSYLSGNSEQWLPHKQEARVTAKLAGAMYSLTKGTAPEQEKQSRSSNCHVIQQFKWWPDRLTVMKQISGQCRESESRSARYIARLRHSCRIAQSRAQGEGLSLHRACRQWGRGSPQQDFSQLLFLHIILHNSVIPGCNCTVLELGLSIGRQTLGRWEWKSLHGPDALDVHTLFFTEITCISYAKTDLLKCLCREDQVNFRGFMRTLAHFRPIEDNEKNKDQNGPEPLNSRSNKLHCKKCEISYRSNFLFFVFLGRE